MPYRREGKCVQQKKDGEWITLKCHDTVGEAEAHLTALHMNVEEGKSNMPPANNKAMSLDEHSSMIRHAFYEAFSEGMGEWYDCIAIYDDYLICTNSAGEFRRVNYTMTDDGVEFQPMAEWQMVEREWVAKNADPIVAFGSEIKALGGGKFGGYLVVFGDENNTDLTGDFFTKDTNFDVDDWDTAKCNVFFNHGLDPKVGKKKLCTGSLKMDEVGIWLEGILNERDKYEKAIYDGLIVPRKAGMSSGTLPHLVERERVGKAFHIKHWSLGGDGSITHIPAEWRTTVMPLKSMQLVNLEIPTQPEKPKVSPKADKPQGGAAPNGKRVPETKKITVTEGHRMPENKPRAGDPEAPDTEMKGGTTVIDRLEALQQQMEQTIAVSSKINEFLEFAESSPAIRQSGWLTEDGGTADSGVKTAVDMLIAIKRGDHKRCVKHYHLKAQVEDQGTLGGYFVPEATLTDLFPNLSLVSGIANLVRRVPVPTPAGKAPIRDYSRVPAANVGASASASGIESQARMEGGAYTEETIYFENLEWHVRDFASGFVKMSRELANDAPMVQNMLEEAIREDVANKEEFAILRGTGVGQPLGVLNWSGRIEIAEDTDNTFAIADSDEMVSRLLQSPGARIAWVHHPGVYTNIAGFERGTGGPALQTNISGALATALHGYLRFNSQHLPQQGTTGYVILGDWSRYYLFEQDGLYIQFSEHADFLNGNNVWRFGKRQDGKPAMTSAVTLADGSYTMSPFIVLQNKT